MQQTMTVFVYDSFRNMKANRLQSSIASYPEGSPPRNVEFSLNSSQYVFTSTAILKIYQILTKSFGQDNTSSLAQCESSINTVYEPNSFPDRKKNYFTVTSTSWTKQSTILWTVMDTPSPMEHEVGV
jgi:hypothetical protein